MAPTVQILYRNSSPGTKNIRIRNSDDVNINWFSIWETLNNLVCGFGIKVFKLSAYLGTILLFINPNPTQFSKNDTLKVSRSEPAKSLLSIWRNTEYTCTFKGILWWVLHITVCSREDVQPVLLVICCLLFLFAVLLFLDTFISYTFTYWASCPFSEHPSKCEFQIYGNAPLLTLQWYWCILLQYEDKLIFRENIDNNIAIQWSIFIYGPCLDIKILWTKAALFNLKR